MQISIKKKSIPNSENEITFLVKSNQLNEINISQEEKKYFLNKIKSSKKNIVSINRLNQNFVLVNCDKEINNYKDSEFYRNIGHKLYKVLDSKHIVNVIDTVNKSDILNCILEGLALTGYEYDRFKKQKKDLKIIVDSVQDQNLNFDELISVIESTFLCRDLVNDPFSHLKAKDLATIIKKLGEKNNFKTKHFFKSDIKKMKMGGLLAVNQGSLDEPSFSILEHKPNNAVNKRPLILVGKGIVYDTGGLSLKPTKGMDIMKVDMGGAACVISAINAVAKSNLPVHVIGLIPATDNRPSGNAYAPGDVVEMYDGTNVEVLNTDAEGRMILADALSYAKKYNPELVIDMATLTGSAARAIGHFGIVSMHNKAEKQHQKLKEAGLEVYERLAEMPFWDEYDELMKSDIADIRNIGNADFAGAITAGKFLVHFTDYPWIHLDIAGPTYVTSEFGYRGKGATAIGVRLIYNFIKNYTKI